MRTTGIILVVVGLLVAALCALLPVNVSTDQTSGRCGLPIHDGFQTHQASGDDNELEQQCQIQSSNRIHFAMILGLLPAAAGGYLIFVARKRRDHRHHHDYYPDSQHSHASHP